MKLRNKKTGEIREAISYAPIDVYFFDKAGKNGITRRSYGSLAELNEEWEDYVPTEPLIKDEKIRKAVRAWAEACGADDADIVRHYGAERWIGLRYENPNTGWVSKFEIDGFGSCNQLGNGKVYTIAELCGTPEPLEPTFIDLDERVKEKEEE